MREPLKTRVDGDELSVPRQERPKDKGGRASFDVVLMFKVCV
jgi:hypothetical protein